MKSLIMCVLCLGLAAAPARAGETESRTFALQDFTAIDVGGAYELDVEVGPDYGIMLEGHPSEIERAEVDVRDGALRLGSKGRFKREHGEHEGMRAVITLPALDRLSVSGVTDADIRGVDAGAFAVNLSGVGEVTIAGRCSRIRANVSGVGELNARALECGEAEITLSGMGEASVFARDRARAEVSGMGEINIFGSPKFVDKRGGLLAEINVRE